MTRRGDRADLEAANLEERVVLEYEVVPGQHGSVGRRHRHLIPRIAGTAWMWSQWPCGSTT